MNTLVVQRRHTDVVLNDPNPHHLLPVLGQIVPAGREGIHGLHICLVWEGVGRNLFGQKNLNRLLARLQLFQIRISIYPMEHILLLHTIRTQRQKHNRIRQCLLPLLLFRLYRTRGINRMIILRQFECIAIMTVIFRHEGEEFDFILLHSLLGQCLAVDLVADNGGADEVFFAEGEAHLFEDEFDLFAFGERAVGFDVDFLEDIGGS
mmetsp:Transcript_11825/g.17255  ORF Transcript_11825/g.17255 Transcript_11825/m.17255 type:complete len:207 (-) Transcript_11825:401-1021(-)